MITIREFTTDERNEYEEEKYQEFLEYYLNTEMGVGEIMRKMDINNRNNLARVIREKLRKNGYNSDVRYKKILRGEWLKWQTKKD